MSLRLGPLAVVGFCLCLLACKPTPPPPDHLTLAASSFAELEGWAEDGMAPALEAFRRSCRKLLQLAPESALGIAGKAADWREPCAAAEALPAADDAAARSYFASWFRPWRAGNNGRPEGLFTGYYEPELRGAREPGGAFATPLLRRPPDLVMVELGQFRPAWRGERIAGRVVDGRLKPYETRAEIEAGALDRRHLAFLWIDDAVDAFFLQIQGSGRVRLSDGSVVRVGYDGQNGHPYVAIGKLLVERGALSKEAATMQGIRAWIAAHAEEGRALMRENPSYVFFREVTGDGPLGSEGTVLVPGRSLAVDRSFLPLGLPIWLDAEGEGPTAPRLRRLLVAQDTGGAIRGPVRGDVFWGHGPEAEARAGSMRARGEYYILLPKTLATSP